MTTDKIPKPTQLSLYKSMVQIREFEEQVQRSFLEGLVPVSYTHLSVDSAVWDAFGKAVGQPLHRIWGGAKESLPVIGIGGYYEDGKEMCIRDRYMMYE